MMRRHLGKLAVVMVLLSTLTVVLFVQLAPIPSEQQSWTLAAENTSQLPQQFTLLNWNIQKRADESNWQQQYQQIQQLYQPDLVTLQEVNVTSKNENPSNKPAVYAPNLKTIDGYAGLLTAANNLPYANEARLSAVTEPIFTTPKPGLYSYYQFDQHQLLVVNIHAINFVTNHSYQLQVSDLVQQVTKHNGPVIVSGDFNSWSQNRLNTLLSAMGSLGLSQVGFNDSDELKSVFGNPLDHVFFSQHLQVISSEVLEQFDSSDHLPMVVEFRFR